MSRADSTAHILEPSPADVAEVREVLDDIARGHRDRDARAITRSFAPDAVLADLAPPLLRHGPDADGLQAWLDKWDGPVEITYRDLTVTVSGDVALCYGENH